MLCVLRLHLILIVALVLQVLLRYAPELRGKQDHKFISSRMRSLPGPLVLGVLQVRQVLPVLPVLQVVRVLPVLQVVRGLPEHLVPLPVRRAA